MLFIVFYEFNIQHPEAIFISKLQRWQSQRTLMNFHIYLVLFCVIHLIISLSVMYTGAKCSLQIRLCKCCSWSQKTKVTRWIMHCAAELEWQAINTDCASENRVGLFQERGGSGNPNLVLPIQTQLKNFYKLFSAQMSPMKG